jgi:hypothetical protein
MPSWGASNCTATQELPNILRNPKVQYRTHKRSSLIPILSQIIPIHTIPSCLPKIRFDIVHPPTSCSSHWHLYFWFSQQYLICIFPLPFVLHPRPSHPTWLDHSNYTWRRVQVMKLLIMLFSPTSCHFNPLRSNYSHQHPVLTHPHSVFLS